MPKARSAGDRKKAKGNPLLSLPALLSKYLELRRGEVKKIRAGKATLLSSHSQSCTVTLLIACMSAATQRICLQTWASLCMFADAVSLQSGSMAAKTGNRMTRTAPRVRGSTPLQEAF